MSELSERRERVAKIISKLREWFEIEGFPVSGNYVEADDWEDDGSHGHSIDGFNLAALAEHLEMKGEK